MQIGSLIARKSGTQGLRANHVLLAQKFDTEAHRNLSFRGNFRMSATALKGSSEVPLALVSLDTSAASQNQD